MHRAYSVIFFTTSSGAGYGLLFWLCVYGLGGKSVSNPSVAWSGFVLGFALVVFGLLSSTFHLGHKERAWRALSQWRSSWLSREGVMAIVTFVPTGLVALNWLFVGQVGGIWIFICLLGALCAMGTVLCTGQIYASLKAIPRWHHRAVTPLYIVFSLASGSVLLSLILTFFPVAELGYQLRLSMLLIFAAACLKFAYWSSIDSADERSTTATATGLGDGGPVRPLDPPHVQANYLQKEMGYQIAQKHSQKLRKIALFATFILPLLALIVQMSQPVGLLASLCAVFATASMALGLVVERWLFFAEAKHKVTLYYGAEAV